MAGRVGAQVGDAVLDQFAQFQATFRGLGLDQIAAQEVSQQLTSLTNDFIAFDDTIRSSDEAIRRLQAALAGEARAARFLKIGADIRDIQLSAELFQTIGKTARQASELERVLGRLRIIRRAALQAGVIGQAVREAVWQRVTYIPIGGPGV